MEAATTELQEAKRRRSNEHELALVRRRLENARRAVATAEDDVRAARERKQRLEEEATSLEDEIPRLERRADTAARAAADVPRLSAEGRTMPAGGVPGVLEWAARTRPAVFVAKGGLERELDGVVREANELLAGVLGEPSGATSVPLVRRRLERELV